MAAAAGGQVRLQTAPACNARLARQA
jgi:hypothetical protein